MRAVGQVFVIALVCLLIGPADLSAQKIGASLRVGTGGVGVGVGTQLASTLNGRVGVSYFSFSAEGTEVREDVTVDWDAEGDLLFVSALLDWHPFTNTFRITGGAMYNDLAGRGGAVPANDMTVGRNTYTPEQVGILDVHVSFGSKVAPYVGLGFGNSVTRRFGFLLDLGVMYAGSPAVSVDATGMLTPTESEAAPIEDNIEWVQWYPLLSVGFSARLN